MQRILAQALSAVLDCKGSTAYLCHQLCVLLCQCLQHLLLLLQPSGHGLHPQILISSIFYNTSGASNRTEPVIVTSQGFMQEQQV